MVYSLQKTFDGSSGEFTFRVPRTCGLLKIESSGGSLSIAGKLTAESSYTSLAAVNCSTLAKATSITASGIYNVEVAGLHSIKLEYTGSGTVITALVE